MLNVVLVGILFAAVAMVLNSCGALLQADGARRATRTKPAAIQPRYLAGMLVDLVAWGCAVLALRVLPVFAVQAVIGGTIALTAVVSARLIGARLPTATRLVRQAAAKWRIQGSRRGTRDALRYNGALRRSSMPGALRSTSERASGSTCSTAMTPALP